MTTRPDPFGGDDNAQLLYKKLLDELSLKLDESLFNGAVEQRIMLFFCGEVPQSWISDALHISSGGKLKKSDISAAVQGAVKEWRTDRLSQQLFSKVGGMQEYWKRDY